MSSPPAAVEERISHPQGSRSPVIVFEDVPIAFQGKQVLDGISFRLPRGETKAIFGVAGSGKSTILKMAIGLLKPDSGQIYLLGEEITQKPEEELFEFEYWDLEQAKLRRVGAPPMFAGEIACVTGAASGIGKACVEALLKRGATVRIDSLTNESHRCGTPSGPRS